jgi:hypothetical protein
MVKIIQIMYGPMEIDLIDDRGVIQKTFSYTEWQKWLRKNGGITFPFNYTTKKKGGDLSP